MEPWRRALLKDDEEDGETWLPGERAVRGSGRKPSAWLPWFPGVRMCEVTVHSPGVGPGGHAGQSPEGEGRARERPGQSGARLEAAPGESWVEAGLQGLCLEVLSGNHVRLTACLTLGPPAPRRQLSMCYVIIRTSIHR